MYTFLVFPFPLPFRWDSFGGAIVYKKVSSGKENPPLFRTISAYILFLLVNFPTPTPRGNALEIRRPPCLSLFLSLFLCASISLSLLFTFPSPHQNEQISDQSMGPQRPFFFNFLQEAHPSSASCRPRTTHSPKRLSSHFLKASFTASGTSSLPVVVLPPPRLPLLVSRREAEAAAARRCSLDMKTTEVRGTKGRSSAEAARMPYSWAKSRAARKEVDLVERCCGAGVSVRRG